MCIVYYFSYIRPDLSEYYGSEEKIMKKKYESKNIVEPVRNQLKDVLRELINKKELEISDKNLAKKLNINYTTLYALLKATNTNPKVETLIPIAEFFGVTIDQLIGLKPLSDESSSKEQHKWVAGLYFECFKICTEQFDKLDFKPTAEHALQIIKDCYIYMLTKKKGKMDKEFIRWIVEKNLDGSSSS